MGHHRSSRPRASGSLSTSGGASSDRGPFHAPSCDLLSAVRQIIRLCSGRGRSWGLHSWHGSSSRYVVWLHRSQRAAHVPRALCAASLRRAKDGRHALKTSHSAVCVSADIARGGITLPPSPCLKMLSLALVIRRTFATVSSKTGEI
jgi:hypothetical protein